MIEHPVALVTGANKGIGFELARQLGVRGVTVLVGARDATRGEAAASKLREEGLHAALLLVDVTDPSSIRDTRPTGRGALRAPRHPGQQRWRAARHRSAESDRSCHAATDLRDKCRRSDSHNAGGAAAAAPVAGCPRRQPVEQPRVFRDRHGSGVAVLRRQPSRLQRVKGSAECRHRGARQGVARHLDQGERRGSRLHGTELNEYQGPRTVEEGARAAVHVALLGPDGPTGQFFDEEGTVSW